jgi:peptidyl-prolyl cis-trans isomerase C
MIQKTRGRRPLNPVFPGVSFPVRLKPDLYRKENPMNRICIALIVPALLAFAIQGCGGKGKSEGDNSAGSAGTGDAATADGRTIVTVNGLKITEGEVGQETKLMMQQMSGRMDPAQLQSMGPEIRQHAVTNIVNRTLLRQAADREGMTVTKAEEQVRIDEIKANFPDSAAFNAQLENSGLTMEGFKKEIVYSIKIESLIEKMTSGLPKPTEADAREFYDSNTEQFVSAERIKASHILIKVAPEDTDMMKAEKRKKIEEIRARLVRGEDFAKVAAENSECPSSASGGDLGFFSRGQMIRPFEDAAFSLKTGVLSEIVETTFGFHVIKITDRESATTTAFAEVKSNIVEYLGNMRKQQEVEKYIGALRDLAKIEYADSTAGSL